MPVFVVTYTEEQEVVVVVEAASQEAAEEAVDASAQAGDLDEEGWECTTHCESESTEEDEAPAYRVDADSRELRKI